MQLVLPVVAVLFVVVSAVVPRELCNDDELTIAVKERGEECERRAHLWLGRSCPWAYLLKVSCPLELFA